MTRKCAWLRLWKVAIERRLFRCLSLCLVAASICVASGCKKGTIVRGRVTNATTGQAVSGAKVTVRFERLDANYNWVDAGHAELASGPGGEFSIEHRQLGGRFVVSAEREGFYPNHDYRRLRKLERHALRMDHLVEIQLYPILSPKPLPTGEGEVRFATPGQRTGWNFAASRMAPEAASDIVGEADETARKIASVVARGRGGILRVPGLSGEWALFNMPEAPRDGYQERVDLREIGEGERACCYVRTADGQHYAKIVIAGELRSREFFGIRFTWVYQPDGSRALEIPFDKTAK